MLNYKSLHYSEYKEMLPNGECLNISRRACFALPQKPTAANPFVQRWYYSPDRSIAIRLPRNAMGDEIGKKNAADLKWLERTEERKWQCVGKTENRCSVTCDRCPIADVCESPYINENGKGCPKKCEFCSVSVSRTVELDRQFRNDDNPDMESGMDIEDTTANVSRFIEDLESSADLYAAYKWLDPSDQLLFRLMGAKAKKAVIAKKMNMTLDGVRYRENRLRKILCSDPALKDCLRFLK